MHTDILKEFPGRILVWSTKNICCYDNKNKYVGKSIKSFSESFKSKDRMAMYKIAMKLVKEGKKVNSQVETNGITSFKSMDNLLLEVITPMENKNRLTQNDIKSHHIFMASMSHEIRNPLNGIMGMISVMKETKLSAKQQNILEIMLRSSYDLMAMVNDILDISKLDIGAIQLTPDVMSIYECVESCHSILCEKARDKNIEFDYHIQNKIPEYLIQDYTRVRQILVNIASNAIKFTDKGSVFINVTIHKRTKKKYYLKFEVTDTGFGIKKKDFKKLFLNFSKLNSGVRFQVGTGLGLSISRQLCELMKGSIDVESVYGKGSTFSFIIPFEKTKNHISCNFDLTGVRVLVVDDKVANIIPLCKLLQKWGMNYKECTSGDQVSMLYLEQEFDIGLLDICMPGMDGNALAKKIKTSGSRYPLIALSSANEMVNTVTHYFDDHLVKPYKNSVLQSKIIKLLRKNKKSRMKVVNKSPSNNIKVLIAEDMPFNRAVLKEMLDALGYKKFCAVENGEELVAEIVRMKREKSMYDVILLDIIMPKMNGIEAMKKIDEILNKKERPKIIAVTAMASEKQMRKYKKKIKFDDYLTKPIQDASVLNNAIKRSLSCNKVAI